MTELDAAAEEIDWAIRTLTARLPAEGRYPPDDEGDLTNLAHYYRLRGIASFLRDGDGDAYAADLFRAGRARLYYLQGCAAGATGSPRFYRTSCNDALYDALAVGDTDTAERIAQLCEGRYAEAWEYEEDHLAEQYLQTFFLVLRGKRGQTDAAAVLRRLSDAAGPGGAALALARALDARDADRIAGAVAAVSESRGSAFRQAAERGDLPRVVLQTERHIDVQLIGVLRFLWEAGLDPLPGGAARIPAELCALSRTARTHPAPGSWRGGP